MQQASMLGRLAWIAAVPAALTAAGCSGADSSGGQNTTPTTDELEVAKEVVGKLLYFDTNLSSPSGQSCGSCHDPETGYAEPNAELPVSQGVLAWLTGNRNAPSAAYAAYSPSFHLDDKTQAYVGGQFWDGRAATLADQAKGPFLNPLEMHNADKASVIASVKASSYADLFERAFGAGSLDATDAAYDKVADAIAAWEATPDVVRFTSKFDAVQAGKDQFTDQEAAGFDLFENKALCSSCHKADALADGTPALFTDFTYDDLGVPKNPELPFYKLPAQYNPDGDKFIDRGLGPLVKDAKQDGKFKVPTLRNIAKTAPYMHNGVFKTLKEVVDFYNTRDVAPAGTWGPPEVPENMNTVKVGNLKLTDTEVEAIVAFMTTLSDGYVPLGK